MSRRAQVSSQKRDMRRFPASFRSFKRDEDSFAHLSRTIIIRIMRRFFACFLLLAGCAAPTRVGEEKVPPPVAAPAHPFREMVVYIPQTDDTAAVWLKWFVKYPS